MYNKISVQISEVQKQLDKTSEYKSTLYENYISGILNKEDYKTLNTSYSYIHLNRFYDITYFVRNCT